jgi:hypothetical protein
VVTFLSVLLVVTSIGMIVLVLLHRGKGGGLSNLFGGGVSSSLGGSAGRREEPRPHDRRLRRRVGGVHRRARPAAQGHRRGGLVGKALRRAGSAGTLLTAHPYQRRSTSGRRQRDPWQSSGRRSHGRGRAGRVAPSAAGELLVRERARDASVVRRRRRHPRHLGLPALRLPGRSGPRQPAGQTKTEPYKTHLAYVRERRNDEDGEAILAEALAKLRGRKA